MKIKLYVLLTVFSIVLVAGIGYAKKNPKTDAEPDTFYEKARLIMTSEEKDIYRHLPDNASKEAFIKDFWEKRDPDPSTEVNEVKEEFESRITYANKWFKEGSKDRGWDTERGRILLLLGLPDERKWGDAVQTDSLGQMASSKRVPMEIWTYYSIAGGIRLIFEETDDTGKMRLREYPTNLQSALDTVKFMLDLRDPKKLKNAFKFEAVFHDTSFTIKIPIKKVNFLEKEGKMTADFEIVLYVYWNSEKIDTVKTSKTIEMDKEEILKLKNFEFTVPYSIRKSGKYYFDIVIEDRNSNMKYRNFTSFKK
jgi:GWxTD domain-containing protein